MPIYSSPRDEAAEKKAQEIIEKAWNCKLKHMGKLSEIDWVIISKERITGFMELKTRYIRSDKYDTVYVSMRKWISLMMAQIGFGVHGFYAIQYDDCIKWIRIKDTIEHKVVLQGNKQRNESDNDIEPLILLPIEKMETINA